MTTNQNTEHTCATEMPAWYRIQEQWWGDVSGEGCISACTAVGSRKIKMTIVISTMVSDLGFIIINNVFNKKRRPKYFKLQDLQQLSKGLHTAVKLRNTNNCLLPYYLHKNLHKFDFITRGELTSRILSFSLKILDTQQGFEFYCCAAQTFCLLGLSSTFHTLRRQQLCTSCHCFVHTN